MTGAGGVGTKVGGVATIDATRRSAQADAVAPEGHVIDSRLVDILGVVVVLGLPMAWWLSLLLLVETSVVDLTPPKIVAIASLGLALLTRPWRFVGRADALTLGLFAVYAGWFVVTSALRASAGDAKLTLGYVIFLLGPMLAAYVAARLAPGRTSYLLVGAVLVALAATFAGVIIERFTYPGLDGTDPLSPLWSFFRPQSGMQDPILGTVAPPSLHFSSGDPMIPRVTAWFAHVNYLAFFAVLAGVLGATLTLWGLRRRHRAMTVAGALAVAAASLITVWTYSRVGLVGLPIGIIATIVIEIVARGRPTAPSRWLSLASPVVIAGLVLGVALLLDPVGLRRMVPPVDQSTGGLTVGEQAAAIEASAERSTALRITMQMTALEMIAESPAGMIIGPGQRAFEAAVHRPDSPHYVAEAIGVRDPNSLWLSVALSGGVVGVVLLILAFAVVAGRLWRIIRSRSDSPSTLVTAWLAAWFVTWAGMQFLGTYPFAPSEAVILGTLTGVATGLSSTGDRTLAR